ncbi:MAG: cytochrome c4 [Betaproteobacteria bacterium]
MTAATEEPAFEDSIAQRVQACTGCHGKEGRAASDGYYPRIAGKPAGYLLNQLRNFREGRRQYPLMVSLIDQQTDDYLREMADYFAALDLPYPPHQAPTAAGEVLRRGERLVREGDAAREIPACDQCHGRAMMGVAPAIPGLLGLPRDYINGQLGAWKSGIRHAAAPDCMAQVAQRLSTDDIRALSQWLAAQPVTLHAKPATVTPASLPLECGSVPASGGTER